MSGSKDNKLTPEQKKYQDLAKAKEPQRPLLKNCINAFLVGGFICAFGQVLKMGFIKYFGFTEKTAGDPTLVTVIFLAALLTGLGVYDRIAQWAGAGTIIPITGFANAMTSAAIEHRSEGYVLGTGGNMFKIAGSVITFGAFSAFAVGLIKVIINLIGGM